MAPYSAYHPAPTRPAFTPWALDDSAHDAGLLTTWGKGMARLPGSPADNPYDQPPDNTRIAREPTFTVPQGAVPSSSSDGSGVTRASTSGCHSAP
jgi:hypothetical protein